MTNPGAWRLAGMIGAVTGININDALLRIDQTGLDPCSLRLLMTDGERGVVRGAQRAAEQARAGAARK